MNVPARIATWWGVGGSPKAPGTMGSLAALPLAYVVHIVAGDGALLALGLALFLVGIWACNGYLKAHPEKDDPKEVVIDEVAAQCMVLSMLSPTLLGYAIGFALFRVFDIVKPWPISWADRTIGGGIGIMVDDLLAAVAASVMIVGIGAL